MRFLTLIAFAPRVAGHTAIVSPPSRNAIDRNLDTWAGAVPEPVKAVSACEGGWFCPIADSGGASFSAANGQACFWFSNGCAIGCDTCDGSSRGPETRGPGKPKSIVCNNSAVEATICDSSLRTVNTDAACGSDADRYYFSPWRAPGSAGVFDACGMAGGRTGTGGTHGATYKNTSHAKLGDLGSKVLARLPSGTAWEAGSTVEVSWAVTANHGGGYQYRLCPAKEELTEECFQRRPLPFVGRQSFRWGGPKGKQIWFNGTYVSEGTTPKGSTWAMNPIPRNDRATGKGFEPRCEENPSCKPEALESTCFCSGMWGPYDLEIVDAVQLPADLEEGEWVLGWRNDCEESNQIWNSCSDVSIVSKRSPVMV